MEIDATMKYHHSLSRLARIRKPDNDREQVGLARGPECDREGLALPTAVSAPSENARHAPRSSVCDG